MIDQEGKRKVFQSRNNINFGIADTLFLLNTDKEAITIILKDLQISTSISNIHNPPASVINTTRLSNMKNSAYIVIKKEISTAILFNFSTKINRFIFPPIKVNLKLRCNLCSELNEGA